MESLPWTNDPSAGGREHGQNRHHAGPFPSHESEKEDVDHVLYLVSSRSYEYFFKYF